MTKKKKPEKIAKKEVPFDEVIGALLKVPAKPKLKKTKQKKLDAFSLLVRVKGK